MDTRFNVSVMVEHRYIIIEKKDEVYLTIDAESDIRES